MGALGALGLSGATPASAAQTTGADFLRTAETKTGCSYLWGGTGPDAFDCSGLIQWALKQLGVDFPRTSELQIGASSVIDLGLARKTPGAIMWRFGHVGISCGDGVHTFEARNYDYPLQRFDTEPGTSAWVSGGLVPGLIYPDLSETISLTVDGYWGFEGGQTAVGDIFAWFVDTCVPVEYKEEAASRGVSVHDLLVEKSKDQEIGEHGLVALDWHNGNRSILADARLSGLIVGQTLTTRPEDMYRALLEATAFGCRVIIDNFVEHGIKVDEIVAAGGLLKNAYYMQMLADITRRPISVSAAEQTGALGSAVFAAVAAGVYPDVFAAADAMSSVEKHAYEPNLEASARYDEVYDIYKELHDFFGRYNGVSPMHRLKDIRARVFRDKDAEQ